MNHLDLILSRLSQPPRKAPARAGAARAYRAACPACGGHGMPLSLAETGDGMPLLHCFAGCSALDVLHAMGLTFADVLPERLSLPTRGTGNGGPSAWGALASALDALNWAHCRLLAVCSPSMQTAAIEASLRAALDAGEAMQAVKDMARMAMRTEGKGVQS